MALVDTYGPLQAVPEMGTPEWHRDRLLKALDARTTQVKKLEDYYDGCHPAPAPPQELLRFQSAATYYAQLTDVGLTNYCPPIPDAKRDRLTVTGFRFGEPENFADDTDAWRIWQRNHLDADSGSVHHDALVTGQSLVLVWADGDRAQITPEHPSQAIVAYQPGSLRQRLAGLKSWCEDDGTKRVVLYLPDAVYKWRTDTPAHEDSLPTWVQWQPATDDTWPIVNPLGVVPLVEFRSNPGTRPTPFGGGRSELSKGVLAIQDRINRTVFVRCVVMDKHGYPQRWITGWAPDNPDDQLQVGAAMAAAFDDPDVKLGQWPQADFTPFLSAVSADVEALGAVTATPFYALGKLANPPSGDALLALQAGLVAKTEAHRDNFTESWEEVVRLGLQVEGTTRADEQTQIVWADVAHHTWAEKADAAVKIRSVGVPDEAVWQMLGYTNQDIERFKVMQADQALFAPVPGAAQ